MYRLPSVVRTLKYIASGFIPTIFDFGDLIEFLSEGEIARAFVHFVAGVGTDVNGERHRSTPTLNCFAPLNTLAIIAPLFHGYHNRTTTRLLRNHVVARQRRYG